MTYDKSLPGKFSDWYIMSNDNEADKRLLEFGLGSVTWWGYSSSCDLSHFSDKSDINVLIAGGSDGRHLLELFGKANGEKKISAFLIEQNLMLYARQMLFLSIILDDSSSINSQEKSKILLEILGNVKIRPSTAKYLRMNASKLIDICGNEASREEDQPNQLSNGKWLTVDMSKLKYKELDGLEAIFRLWRSDDGFTCDMENAWNSRVEQLLQQRAQNKVSDTSSEQEKAVREAKFISFRDGVFDMDYQFRLVERGGGNISLMEYKDWRKQGNAYVFKDDSEDDLVASQPNMTLVSSVKSIGKDNEKQPSSKSFFGDIVTGPFLSYGLDPSYEALSVDKTKITRPSQELSLSRIQDLVMKVEEKIQIKEDCQTKIEVVFLPLTAERDIKRSSKEFDEKFDVCFIACSVAHMFTTEFTKNVISGGSIILETPLFLLHMAKEIQEKFKEHLQNIALNGEHSAGLKLEDENYDSLKASTVVIKKE